MKDLREKFLDEIINDGGNPYGSSEKCVQIAETHAKDEAIGFVEWTCGRYIKLHSVWVGIYSDQRNKDNWRTTEQLYSEYEIYQQQKEK